MVKLICPNEFGKYDNKIYLQFPDHMLSKYGGFYTNKEGCIIDLCIAEEISHIWEQGISTYGSCCGHGLSTGMINVDEKDVSKMVNMGYDFHPEIREGNHPYTFIPKSFHKEVHEFK